MLQILVNFTGDNPRIAKKFFRDELDRVFSEHFKCFTESHYTLCHISDTSLFICIDLSVRYSMLFAQKVADISVCIDNMYVVSINYTV